MTMDRANRRSRRRAGWIVLAVGVVFAVAGIVLPFILGAAFVSFPGGPVDQTIQANGSYTQLVNPATLAPQTGQTRDLCLNRRLRTVETTGNTVILQQDDSESIGTLSPPPKVPDCTLPWLHVSQRYAIDQDSVRNVASPQAYAYAPGNTVDRSPAYSVNLPLGTGNGPYLMWDDATGSTYPLTADGSTTVDRLQLKKFHGHLDAAPVSAAFLATLAPLGLTSTMTLDQLTPQLTAAGVDVNQLRNVAVLQLNGNDKDVTSDRAVVDGILQAPQTISYLLATDVQLLVYPKTGTIVSADVRQTLEMRPDITGIDRVLAIISQPKYAGRVGAGRRGCRAGETDRQAADDDAVHGELFADVAVDRQRGGVRQVARRRHRHADGHHPAHHRTGGPGADPGGRGAAGVGRAAHRGRRPGTRPILSRRKTVARHAPDRRQHIPQRPAGLAGGRAVIGAVTVGGSGRPVADQPDGGRDEQRGQAEQVAALDPLEWPEPAAWLVAHPVLVAVLGDVAHRVDGRVKRVGSDLLGGWVVALEELADRRLAERLSVPPGVPRADEPGGTRQVGVVGD